MTGEVSLIAMAAAVLALALGAVSALKGWQDWLALRRQQLLSGGVFSGPRSDLAELKARVRTLERIALGID